MRAPNTSAPAPNGMVMWGGRGGVLLAAAGPPALRCCRVFWGHGKMYMKWWASQGWALARATALASMGHHPVRVQRALACSQRGNCKASTAAGEGG